MEYGLLVIAAILIWSWTRSATCLIWNERLFELKISGEMQFYKNFRCSPLIGNSDEVSHQVGIFLCDGDREVEKCVFLSLSQHVYW